MTINENVRIGLDALLSHKLRSLLTMLGIIFGVAAVIAMTSISAGARRELMESIKTLGVNNIIVNVVEPDDEQEKKDHLKANPKWLNLADAEALKALLEDVHYVVPIRRIEEHVYMPEENKSGLIGTTPDFANVFNVQLQSGRFLSDSDLAEKKSVAVITTPLQRKLFPITPPIGKRIKVNKDWFTVIGVIDAPGGGFSALGMDMPNMEEDVFVPMSTVNSRRGVVSGQPPLQSILVQVKKPENVRPVAAAMHRTMERRHRGVADYQIVVPIELLKQSQQTQHIFNIVMGAIASISLLVGGIGIMNIMLSNVLERTREIGIRRALGATQKDVVFQFLLEAIMLSVFGGLIGIVMGFGMAWGINIFAGWRTAVGPFAVFLAFGVSAGVGIIFGWWPAKKASEMDVINALRYE